MNGENLKIVAPDHEIAGSATRHVTCLEVPLILYKNIPCHTTDGVTKDYNQLNSSYMGNIFQVD